MAKLRGDGEAAGRRLGLGRSRHQGSEAAGHTCCEATAPRFCGTVTVGVTLRDHKLMCVIGHFNKISTGTAVKENKDGDFSNSVKRFMHASRLQLQCSTSSTVSTAKKIMFKTRLKQGTYKYFMSFVDFPLFLVAQSS